jgi:hypothetical protein
MSQIVNSAELRRCVDSTWDDSIVPELCNYVRIPNVSPLFAPQGEQHGHMERAVKKTTPRAARILAAATALRIRSAANNST